MFIITNFIHAIATIADMILSIYMWIIIARAIVSWVSPFSRIPSFTPSSGSRTRSYIAFAESSPCEESVLIFPP